MTVSTYDDPLKFQVLPLAADAAILFTIITGALVQVRIFIEFDGEAH